MRLPHSFQHVAWFTAENQTPVEVDEAKRTLKNFASTAKVNELRVSLGVLASLVIYYFWLTMRCIKQIHMKSNKEVLTMMRT